MKTGRRERVLEARCRDSRTANASLPSTQRRRNNPPLRRSNSSARSSTAACPPSSHFALHTSQSSPGAYAAVSCIGDWECAHACTGANANTNSTGTSVLLPLPRHDIIALIRPLPFAPVVVAVGLALVALELRDVAGYCCGTSPKPSTLASLVEASNDSRFSTLQSESSPVGKIGKLLLR